ncbi:uncharacterized protein TNCV_4184311 [Trichonephila clavipes]|nr:uncharacterized protein TNCV_4184311 [Trichonephila clavipes]
MLPKEKQVIATSATYPNELKKLAQMYFKEPHHARLNINELSLLETWLDNDECISIPNFYCCVQFERPGHRAAGVSIYGKWNNSHVVTPHVDIIYPQAIGLGIASQDIGDICAAEAYLKIDSDFGGRICFSESNGSKSQDSLHFVLLSYTEDGSALLKSNYHSLSMILSGDFNINYSLPEAEQLIAFLTDELKLEMNTN